MVAAIRYTDTAYREYKKTRTVKNLLKQFSYNSMGRAPKLRTPFGIQHVEICRRHCSTPLSLIDTLMLILL